MNGTTNRFMGDATVVQNRTLSPEYHLLTVQLPAPMAQEAVFLPGSFVELLAPTPQVLLRRPISVSDWDAQGGTIELLIQSVGKGSSYFNGLAPGARLNLVGPLGHGFTTDPTRVGNTPLLIGGGVGVAPIRFLAKVLHRQGITPYILQGARRADLLVLGDELKEWGTLLLTTDDGSAGTRGTVLDHPALSTQTFTSVFVCGPHPMMKAVAQRFEHSRGLVEVSLENKMACGIGACLCCVTPTTERHNVCVCTQGPVFDARTILW